MTEKLAENIFLIPGRWGGRYPHCNSLYLEAAGGLVIDPGSDKKLLRELGARGVGRVLLSHFHSDHVRDLRELKGARTYIHQVEREAVESPAGMRRAAFFPDEERDPVWERRKDREVGGWGWPVAGTFGDGDVLEAGGTRIEVIHAPGHTAGHCCFWLPGPKLLFSADVDLTEFGPWYANASSDLDDFRRTLARLALLEPRLVVTGHEAGVVTQDFRPRLERYLAILEQRHHRVLDFLATPRSLDEIVAQAIVYGESYSPDTTVHPQEKRMIRQHLKSALAAGEAREVDGGFVRAPLEKG